MQHHSFFRNLPPLPKASPVDCWPIPASTLDQHSINISVNSQLFFVGWFKNSSDYQLTAVHLPIKCLLSVDRVSIRMPIKYWLRCWCWSRVSIKSGCFHTRGQTNHLRRTNRLMCKQDKQILRGTNRLIFGHLERWFFQVNLPVETNKSATVRHKFTSDGQMPDYLSIQMICSFSSVKTANIDQH